MNLPWGDPAGWEARRREQEAAIALASLLRWEVVHTDAPEFGRYVYALDALASAGGCVAGRFRAHGSLDAKPYLLAQSRLANELFFRELFSSEAVRSSLSQLDLPESLDGVDFTWNRTGIGALTLDGVLAGLLVHGGAHDHYSGSWSEAKRFGQRVADELTGGRVEDFAVFVSNGAWSDWFHDLIDCTCVLVDTRLCEVTVICFTDSD